MAGADAEQFVVLKIADRFAQAWINDPGIGQGRGAGRQRLVLQRVFAQELTQRPPALAPARQAGVEPLIIAPKRDAEDGFDARLTAARHEFNGATCVVGVG